MMATSVSITDSDPPGWPEPAWVSIRMIWTRQARAMASRRTSPIELLHEPCDVVDPDVGDGDLGRVGRLVGAPDDRALHVLGDADDVVQERGDVVVDPDRVRLDRLGDPAVANDIGIRHDRTGEIARAQPVDRVRVPDAADVEPVAHAAQELLATHRLGALDDDVGGGRAGALIELAAAAAAEAEAVAWHQRGRPHRVVLAAELFGAARIAQEPLAFVP